MALDDASNIPLWVSIGIAGMSLMLFAATWFWYIYRAMQKGNESNKQKSWIPVFHAGFGAFIGLAVVIMSTHLILEPTSFTRTDGSVVVWGRWAFYIPVLMVYTYAVSIYLSRDADNAGEIDAGSFVSSGSVFPVGLGTAALLIATHLTGTSSWFWFAIAVLLNISAIIMLVLSYTLTDKQIKSWQAGLMLALYTTTILVFHIVWALGRSGGNVGGFTFATERWLYTVAEFFMFIVMAVIIYTEGNEAGVLFNMKHVITSVSSLRPTSVGGRHKHK